MWKFRRPIVHSMAPSHLQSFQGTQCLHLPGGWWSGLYNFGQLVDFEILFISRRLRILRRRILHRRRSRFSQRLFVDLQTSDEGGVRLRGSRLLNIKQTMEILKSLSVRIKHLRKSLIKGTSLAGSVNQNGSASCTSFGHAWDSYHLDFARSLNRSLYLLPRLFGNSGISAGQLRWVGNDLGHCSGGLICAQSGIIHHRVVDFLKSCTRSGDLGGPSPISSSCPKGYTSTDYRLQTQKQQIHRPPPFQPSFSAGPARPRLHGGRVDSGSSRRHLVAVAGGEGGHRGLGGCWVEVTGKIGIDVFVVGCLTGDEQGGGKRHKAAEPSGSGTMSEGSEGWVVLGFGEHN